MILKRIRNTFTGFVTNFLVVLIFMVLLWPTIDQPELLSANDQLKASHGFFGHLWLILLMLLVVNLFIPFNFSIPSPIPMMKDMDLVNSFANPGMYFLILGIWLLGAFAGGLASRGGLRSGTSSSVMTFITLNVLFSLLSVIIDIQIAGLSGVFLFIVIFFFTITIGSFFFVSIIGFVGGSIGGILGKMIFKRPKSVTDSVTEE